MAFYPTIREETAMSFNAVVLNMEKDANYLDHPDCPYSETVKAFFRKKIDLSLGSGKSGADLVDLFEGDDQTQVLSSQIIAVINDLESWGNKLTTADNTDKMGYFRTKTALLEKLVNMQERVLTIKEINEFKNTVISFMNEVLNKDQITEFMKRIDGILGKNNDDI